MQLDEEIFHLTFTSFGQIQTEKLALTALTPLRTTLLALLVR